jgi:antitoxin component YwqK of YwqJK toxin-antitoxin module
MKIHLLIILLISSLSSFTQDTINYDLLNRRMPLNLNEHITYLRNVTPYTGTTLKEDSAGKVLAYNNFLEGRKHGYQTKFYPTGELKEKAQYKFGRANGHLTLYYKTGQKMTQLFFEEGVLIDSSKTWYPSGEIKSLSVEDRQNPANGYYCSYYQNGNEEMEIVKGFQTIYYESGEKKAEVLLVMGRPKGEFKKYKKNGKIEIIEVWENDKIIGAYKKEKK